MDRHAAPRRHRGRSVTRRPILIATLFALVFAAPRPAPPSAIPGASTSNSQQEIGTSEGNATGNLTETRTGAPDKSGGDAITPTRSGWVGSTIPSARPEKRLSAGAPTSRARQGTRRPSV